MNNIISNQKQDMFDIYFYEIVDHYDYEDQSPFLKVREVFSRSYEFQEELVTDYSATFLLCLN